MLKVAIVTGSNKGIGFAIVRSLCKTFDGDVYLTSRDSNRGKEAVKELEKEGLKPRYHQLDVENNDSIVELKTFLIENYGGLDVLVNNAGIAYKMTSIAPASEQAENTLKCNFWGLLNVCKILFSILRSHARVVHVSSSMSIKALARCSPSKRTDLLACDSISEICQMMQKFEKDVKDGTYLEKGWPNTMYGVSKIGVTLICPMQQKQFDSDREKDDIVVNACCPGYVSTDMSSFKGSKTIDEGADTPTFLALLPPYIATPRGHFVSERNVICITEQEILNLKA